MGKALTEWSKSLGLLLPKVLNEEEIEAFRAAMEHVPFSEEVTYRYMENRSMPDDAIITKILSDEGR